MNFKYLLAAIIIVAMTMFSACAAVDGKEVHAPIEEGDAIEDVQDGNITAFQEEPKEKIKKAAVKTFDTTKAVMAENLKEKTDVIDDFMDRQTSVVKKTKKKDAIKKMVRKPVEDEDAVEEDVRPIVEKKAKKDGSVWWLLWVLLAALIVAGILYYIINFARPKTGAPITSIHDYKKDDRVVFFREEKEIATWYYHMDDSISKHGEKITGEVKSVIYRNLGNEYQGLVKYYNNKIKDGSYQWYSLKSKKLHEEFSFKKDRRHGPFKTYYTNGRVRMEGNHNEGFLDGVVREYYEEGGVKGTWIHEKGRLKEVFQFYRDKRSLKEEWRYTSDRLEGMAKEYYDTGELKAEVPYKDSQIHGTVKEFYENGNLKEVMEYAQGEELSSKYYDDDGKLRKK